MTSSDSFFRRHSKAPLQWGSGASAAEHTPASGLLKHTADQADGQVSTRMSMPGTTMYVLSRDSTNVHHVRCIHELSESRMNPWVSFAQDHVRRRRARAVEQSSTSPTKIRTFPYHVKSYRTSTMLDMALWSPCSSTCGSMCMQVASVRTHMHWHACMVAFVQPPPGLYTRAKGGNSH